MHWHLFSNLCHFLVIVVIRIKFGMFICLSDAFAYHFQDFKVKDWPENQHGQFYNGDSYIILNVSYAFC